MSAVSDLNTPVLLLAMPQVVDPFFHRSVVLLAAHETEGSVGFVVNRPSRLSIQEILDDLEVPWAGSTTSTAFVGGPVQPQVGTLLFCATPETPEFEAIDCTEIADGIGVTQNLQALREIAASPPSDLRFLLGHFGWGAGQLMDEFQRNDWLTAPVDRDIVFAPDPDLAWQLGLRSVGVDPNSLPSWTESGSDAN